MDKIARKLVNEGDCLIWMGCLNSDGYPKINRNGNANTKGHRYVYEQTKGSIPEGMVIRHTCDNPRCLNPEHLILGTPTENMKDRSERARTFKHVTDEVINRIKELRAQGLSQTKTSKIVGCSQTFISKLELNKFKFR